MILIVAAIMFPVALVITYSYLSKRTIISTGIEGEFKAYFQTFLTIYFLLTFFGVIIADLFAGIVMGIIDIITTHWIISAIVGILIILCIIGNIASEDKKDLNENNDKEV